MKIFLILRMVIYKLSMRKFFRTRQTNRDDQSIRDCRWFLSSIGFAFKITFLLHLAITYQTITYSAKFNLLMTSSFTALWGSGQESPIWKLCFLWFTRRGRAVKELRILVVGLFLSENLHFSSTMPIMPCLITDNFDQDLISFKTILSRFSTTKTWCLTLPRRSHNMESILLGPSAFTLMHHVQAPAYNAQEWQYIIL